MPSVKSASAAWLNEWHASVSCVISLAQTSSVLHNANLCMHTNMISFRRHQTFTVHNVVFTATLMTRAQWSSLGFLGAFLVSLGPLCSVWDLELCWYSSAEFHEWIELKVCELNVNPFLRLHSPLFFCSFIYSFSQSVALDFQVWHIVKKGKWKNQTFLHSLSVDTLLQVQIKGCLHLRFPCT